MRNQFFRIAILLFTIVVTENDISSKAFAESRLKPPCRVNFSNAHISTKYATKYKVLAVKANANVICNKPLMDLVVYIELYKATFFSQQKLATYSSKVYASVPAHRRITVSGPVVACKNWKKTRFFSMVSSTAIIEGKVMRAPLQRSYPQELACGT